MSNNDEFNLRDLLGEDAENVLPNIEDTPASELQETDVEAQTSKDWEERLSSTVASLAGVKPASTVIGICSLCACDAVVISNEARVCRFHASWPRITDCPECARRELLKSPAYMTQGSVVETLAHPMTHDVDVSKLPEVPLEVSPKLADMEDIDEEYTATFNATVAEVKDLSPDDLLTLRHRLEKMIRRVKIQKNAIRATYEGKLHLVDAKKLKGLKDRDSEFMSGRSASKPKAASKARTTKSDAGLSMAEKQVKQFVKLNMDEATIRKTLTAVGTAIPTNLEALITKFKQ